MRAPSCAAARTTGSARASAATRCCEQAATGKVPHRNLGILPGDMFDATAELLVEARPHSHFVQLHDGADDGALLANIGRYLAEGLIRGEGGMVIATEAIAPGCPRRSPRPALHPRRHCETATCCCSMPTRCWTSSWSTASPIRRGSPRSSAD